MSNTTLEPILRVNKTTQCADWLTRRSQSCEQGLNGILGGDKIKETTRGKKSKKKYASFM